MINDFMYYSSFGYMFFFDVLSIYVDINIDIYFDVLSMYVDIYLYITILGILFPP